MVTAKLSPLQVATERSRLQDAKWKRTRSNKSCTLSQLKQTRKWHCTVYLFVAVSGLNHPVEPLGQNPPLPRNRMQPLVWAEPYRPTSDINRPTPSVKYLCSKLDMYRKITMYYTHKYSAFVCHLRGGFVLGCI